MISMNQSLILQVQVKARPGLQAELLLVTGTFEIPVSNSNCNRLTITQTDLNRNTSQFSQNLNLDPVVKSLVPSCSQTFLVGVSLENPFTATLDWKGVPEADRFVTFDLERGSTSGYSVGQYRQNNI